MNAVSGCSRTISGHKILNNKTCFILERILIDFSEYAVKFITIIFLHSHNIFTHITNIVYVINTSVHSPAFTRDYRTLTRTPNFIQTQSQEFIATY